MAFEKTGWVTNILWKTGPKGGKYLTASVQVDGEEARDQNVFGDFMDVFVEANEKGRMIEYTIEKPEGSRYWNVTKASLAELGEASPETQREAKEKGTEDLQAKKGDPVPRTKKGTDTERNRSMALAYAKDLAVAGKIEVEKIMLTAETFVTYIEGE